MFGNNPFLKNDPLLEAVKGAQHDGECRRQAEKIVNEEFGVYSRKAVIREQLAAYDAALEEVYAELKEGNKENKEKKKEHEEKVGFEHIKKVGGFPGQSLKRTARVMGRALTKEGNDGNLANNYPPYDKVTRGDVIAGATDKDQMGGKKKTVKEEEQLDELHGKGSLGKIKGHHEKEAKRAHRKIDKVSGYEKQDALEKKGDYHYAQSERASGLLSRVKPKTTSSGDPLSWRTPSKGLVTRGPRKGKPYAGAEERTKIDIKYALGKHKKPNLPEETDYSAQDRAPVTKSPKGYEDPSTPKVPMSQLPKTGNRAGAVIDSAKGAAGLKEAAYSAKAARAGKDIGKQGKMFSKIAAKAGEKYGSEERGKKVAGAILKKIRAKHMKEDQSF